MTVQVFRKNGEYYSTFTGITSIQYVKELNSFLILKIFTEEEKKLYAKNNFGEVRDSMSRLFSREDFYFTIL